MVGGRWLLESMGGLMEVFFSFYFFFWFLGRLLGMRRG